jgi:hypothetical protein
VITVSSTRPTTIDRERPGGRRFAFGTPRGDETYGRVIEDAGVDPRWVVLPTENVRELACNDDLASAERVPLREWDSGELPEGAREVDWCQISVDLHVRTPLTRREADVYVLRRWFGLERSEIARELDISPNTVDNHLQNVKDIDDEMTKLVVNTIRALDIEDSVLSALPDVEP